jgi:hypothetical protein
VRRRAAIGTAVIVVLEMAASVAINIATGGSAPWAWGLLVVLVIVTCAAVWWRERWQTVRGAPNVKVRAHRRGAVRASPVRLRAAGDATVRVEADRDGMIEGSGVTVDGDGDG